MITTRKSSTVPWRAERTEMNEFVWYTIFDSYGATIMHTEKVRAVNETGLISQVATMLTRVNGSPFIDMGRKLEEVVWRT